MNTFSMYIGNNLFARTRAARFLRAALLSIILLVMIFIAVFSYVSTYRSLTAAEIAKKRSLASLSATIIHERLNGLTDLGVALATRRLVVSNIADEKWDEAITRLEGAPENFPYVRQFFLSDLKGTIMSALPALSEAIGKKCDGTDWYKGARAGWQPYVSDVDLSVSDMRNVHISVAVPIGRDVIIASRTACDVSVPDEKKLGILVMQVRTDLFKEWLKNIDIGPDGFIYIVDRKGHIVMHPKFTSQDGIADFSSVGIVQKAVHGMRGAEVNYNPVEKEYRVAAYEPIPEYGWGVIVTQPARVAFKYRDTVLIYLLVVSCTVLIITALIFLLIMYSLVGARRMQEEQRVVEDRLASIFNASKDGILYITLDGMILDVNDAFCAITGFTRDELMYRKHFQDVTALEYREDEVRSLRKLINTGESQEYEKECMRKDGVRVPVLLTTFVVRDATGMPQAVAAIVKDIRLRKKAEEMLRESEEKFRLLAETVQDVFWMSTPGMKRVIYVNPAYEKIWGRPRETLYNDAHVFTESIYPEDRDRISQGIIADHAKGHWSVDYRIVRPDGEVRWIRDRAYPLKDTRGELQYMVGIATDITEQRKMEEGIREAAQIKARFASIASHELRTPLAVINESINVVNDGLAGDVTSKQRDVLGIAGKNVERLIRLVDDILDLQKMELGKMRFDMQEGDINETVKEVYRTLHSLVEQRGLYLALSLSGNIPGVVYDKDKITQVLVNLLNNAIKFTEKGGVTIRTSREDNAVHVAIQDTGVGVRPEDLKKLFRAFEQVGTVKEKGTGLGLAISKEIIEEHHGKIWAESQYGKGTTLHFLLPIIERRRRY